MTLRISQRFRHSHVLKSRGFVLLSTLVVINTVFSTLTTTAQFKMHQRLQKVYYQQALEKQMIEIRAVRCLVDEKCYEDLSFQMFDSSVEIHLLADMCEIHVSGRHEFKAVCTLNLDNFYLSEYTYSANE